MILFFEHLEIDTLKLEGLFQNGDYIVSSLVASQLVAHVYGYIDRNFNALFGVNLTTYFEGSSFTNVINEIRVNFMMKMYDKHYSDLALLAKPGGQIYFSDTIDQTDFSGKVPVTNIIIPEESLLRLEKHFEINKRACWTWQMFPENKVISGVQAYLLKSKLKSDA